MDCITNLQKKLSDKKFSSARTKCQSIVTNVCVPWALEELKKDLKCVNSVTVSCVNSNYKHMKQLPILVPYFQADGLESPVKSELLTFVEISRETADIIYVQVMKAVADYDLETTLVGLSADNTNTDFGDLFRRGNENVLTKIKSHLNKRNWFWL
jgi:hypothetical protein